MDHFLLQLCCDNLQRTFNNNFYKRGMKYDRKQSNKKDCEEEEKKKSDEDFTEHFSSATDGVVVVTFTLKMT